MICLDDGYRVLRNIRDSPAYLEKCSKDLFAMIRQFGAPTWFATFSAADTKWSFLRKILGQLIDKKDYTDEEIREMSWNDIARLITSAPSHVPNILILWSNSFS